MCIIPFNYSQYYCWICCIAVWFRCAFSALTLLVGWQECWLGDKKGVRPVKTEWWVAGMVICLEWGADLHMAQLMPLPLTVSCFSKIQIGFTFLIPAHPRSPGQRAVKWVCVCVCDSDCWICLGLRMSAVLSDNPHTLGWLCPRVPGLYSHSNYVSISACSYCCFHTSGSVPIGRSLSHTTYCFSVSLLLVDFSSTCSKHLRRPLTEENFYYPV